MSLSCSSQFHIVVLGGHLVAVSWCSSSRMGRPGWLSCVPSAVAPGELGLGALTCCHLPPAWPGPQEELWSWILLCPVQVCPIPTAAQRAAEMSKASQAPWSPHVCCGRCGLSGVSKALRVQGPSTSSLHSLLFTPRWEMEPAPGSCGS